MELPGIYRVKERGDNSDISGDVAYGLRQRSASLWPELQDDRSFRCEEARVKLKESRYHSS